MFAAGEWSNKRNYTEADEENIYSLNMRLNSVRRCGGLTPELRTKLDAIAGDYPQQLAVSLCHRLAFKYCHKL